MFTIAFGIILANFLSFLGGILLLLLVFWLFPDSKRQTSTPQPSRRRRR